MGTTMEKPIDKNHLACWMIGVTIPQSCGIFYALRLLKQNLRNHTCLDQKGNRI